MYDSSSTLVLAEFGCALLVVIGLDALLLRWRDSVAKSHGKTAEQVRLRFSAIMQFRSTLERCIPGVLLVILGIFFALDRSRVHDSDWCVGLLFIPFGCVIVVLLARKSWRTYLELQRLADKDEG
jgi:hypothetical protein